MTSTAGRGALVGLALLWLGGCSDEEPKGPRTWDSCELTESACTCVVREAGSDLEFPPADSCAGFNCCVLQENEQGTAASCTCSDVVGTCEDHAEATDMEAVAQCPPPGELLSSRSMCVPESGECPNRAGDEVSGCCGGLLCLSDGSERVCTEVSDDHRSLAEQCERATLTGLEWLEITAVVITTSNGQVTFNQASLGSSSVGPGGCLTTVQMAFSGSTGEAGADGGVASCELMLDAVLRDGEWVLRRVTGTLDGCEGYSAPAGEGGSFDVSSPEPLPSFGFTLETDYCGAMQGVDHHCASGTFDWELSGTLGGVTFEGGHVLAKGVVCSSSETATCDEVMPGQ